MFSLIIGVLKLVSTLLYKTNRIHAHFTHKTWHPGTQIGWQQSHPRTSSSSVKVACWNWLCFESCSSVNSVNETSMSAASGNCQPLKMLFHDAARGFTPNNCYNRSYHSHNQSDEFTAQCKQTPRPSGEVKGSYDLVAHSNTTEYPSTPHTYAWSDVKAISMTISYVSDSP